MKRFLNLMVAVVAVFMVGFTTVKADQINLVSGKVFFEGAKSPVNGGKRDFHLKQVSGNNSAYAFCLDSQHIFYAGLYNSNSGLNYNSKRIENVILKAYLAGLGTDRNNYGISNDELYQITQMAVWYASHGNGADGMLPGDTYINWINENGKDYRKNIYNYLINDNDVPSIPSTSINVESTNSGLETDDEKNYFGSSLYKVVGPEDVTYTVEATGDACVLYNGTCEKTQTVGANKTFRLRTKYVANKDVTVSATIKSSSYLTGYSFNLYQPTAKGNYQNAAVFIPKFDRFEKTISETGREDVKKRETTLKVSKTDVTGQKEIPGAHMRITDVNGNEIITWESGNSVKEISSNIIKIGEMYKLYEDVAPAGYVPVHNAFGFVLNEDGKVTTCDLSKNEKECVKMSTEDILKIVNEPTKLTVSKTDSTGLTELDGAKMSVYELGKDTPIDSWTSSSKEQHQIKGLVIGTTYKMVEKSSPVGFDEMIVNIYFQLDDNGKVQLCNVKSDDEKNAECGGTVFKDENDVIYAKIKGETLVIINYPSKESSVLVSKMDFTNGHEIKGAKMKICTLAEYEKDGDSCKPSEDSWSWTSSDKPYKIALQPGEYVLFETLPVDGYENYMLISDGTEEKKTTAYKFSIVEGQQTKIDVYNELKAKKIDIPDVPSTGVTTGAYLIGGLVMLVGAGTVVIAKKKENM